MPDKKPPSDSSPASEAPPSESTSLIPTDKLKLFYRDEEGDSTTFAWLTRESEIHHLLNLGAGIDDLESRISTMVHLWGFTDYLFARLDWVAKPSGGAKVIPAPLLFSYKSDRAGLLFQAETNDVRTQQLAALTYFIGIRDSEFFKCAEPLYSLVVSVEGGGVHVTTGGLSREHYLSIASNGDEDGLCHIEAHHEALDLLVKSIKRIGLSRYRSYFTKRGGAMAINSRPLRLLNVMANADVPLKTAAKILCISTDTVNKHVAAAKAAMGTTTTAATIWKAAKLGLIDDEEVMNL